MAIYEFNCPHCKNNILSQNSGVPYTIDTPLRKCPHCNRDYLYPNVYEWSIAGPLGKFSYCFLVNGRWWLMMGVIIGPYNISRLTLLVIWLVFSILRLLIFDTKKIKESYERTKDNPEYIQKLSDLGYARIAFRIDPYYK